MPSVSSCDLPSGLESPDWTDRRIAAAARTWTVAQRTHPGDVAWSAAQHDVDHERRMRVWVAGEVVVAWAVVERIDSGTAYADLHLDPGCAHGATDLRAEVVDYACAHAPVTVIPVLDRDRRLVEACTARGGAERDDEPWFTHLLTDFTDLAPRRLRPLLPEGYCIRPVAADEIVERVEVHRRAWSPVRAASADDVESRCGETRSAFDVEAYERVRATCLYRRSLDMVVEAPDGSLVASALGWFDEVSGSGLIEPVGTDPAHAARGLARAACAELLREMARLGARVALVCPRGDDAYPVPARLYRSLGMRPVARTRIVRIPHAA